MTYTLTKKKTKVVSFSAYYDYSERPSSDYLKVKRCTYIYVRLYKKEKKVFGGYKWVSTNELFRIQRSKCGDTIYLTTAVILDPGEYAFEIYRDNHEGWYDYDNKCIGQIALRGTVSLH